MIGSCDVLWFWVKGGSGYHYGGGEVSRNFAAFALS